MKYIEGLIFLLLDILLFIIGSICFVVGMVVLVSLTPLILPILIVLFSLSRIYDYEKP